MKIPELGPMIAQVRKTRGLTQQDVCKELKMSRVTLSGFENGKKLSLSLRQLALILNLLNLEVDIKEARTLPTLDDLQKT